MHLDIQLFLVLCKKCRNVNASSLKTKEGKCICSSRLGVIQWSIDHNHLVHLPKLYSMFCNTLGA